MIKFKKVDITKYINSKIKKDKFDIYDEIYIKSVFNNLLYNIYPNHKVNISVSYAEDKEKELKAYQILFNDKYNITLSNKTSNINLINRLLTLLPILIDDLYIDM